MNQHLKPRTIREWFELIPFDRAKKEALENISCNDIEVNSLSLALGCGFKWTDTDQKQGQGYEYWRSISISIFNMEQSIKLK